ncbi:MAG: hypothetical protein Q8M07_01085 [Prosthecobacter sp.]|nr:hypothetical protein [Prosthecobacter sp.]
MDELIGVIAAVVLGVLALAVYFWLLEISGLFSVRDWDDEPVDEHEEHPGVGQ